MGITLAIFLFMKQSRDWLIIMVRSFALTLTEVFSRIEEMLSFPIMLFVFIIFFV